LHVLGKLDQLQLRRVRGYLPQKHGGVTSASKPSPSPAPVAPVMIVQRDDLIPPQLGWRGAWPTG